jgi:hypothetical protein
MNVDVTDRDSGRSRLLSRQCDTCVFRPGNLMHLRAGRLADLVADARRAESFVVCHETLPYRECPDFEPAICRGFKDAYCTNYLRILERLDGLIEVDPPGPGGGA